VEGQPNLKEDAAMAFSETMLFYHVIGAAVALAVFLSDRCRERLGPGLGFRLATAVVFWPLYVPFLLARPSSGAERTATPSPDVGDAMARAILRVEGELETALASLDGWAEDVLAHETHRLRELGTAWRAQAERIREIDRLLAATEGVEDESGSEGDATPQPADVLAGDRRRRSEQTRRANLARLRQVRGRAYEDLMGTLSWVRELVSMIHLAKFTGAPASRAGELVTQIAAAVEGISAVTWQADDHPEASTSREEDLPCDSFSASATSSPPT
jgi:hypothetical protein